MEDIILFHKATGFIKGKSSLKKILILEDNEIVLEHLAGLVRELDIKNVIYSFNNVKDAYQCAMERTIDLFLIDIILDTSCPGDVSGMTFVENIRKAGSYGFTPVIIITSLEDSRLYAYEKLHCYRYIEKPFDEGQVRQIVTQCLKYSEDVNETKTLFFRRDGIILAVEREDITYAECCDHIMYMHTRQEDILNIPYITLKKLLEEIDSRDFIQCSRNTIINKKFIQNVDLPNRMIKLKGSLGRVEIGVMFKKSVKECLK